MNEKSRWVSQDKYPCRDCMNRHPACQDHCEEYQRAKAANNARKAMEREKRMIIGAANEYTIKMAATAKRKKLPER